jgi:CrcB protein
MFTLLQIALGGAAGSVLRYLTVSTVGAPWGTAAVNVAGCFTMGVLATLLARHPLAPLFLTGLLGGFTTFSAFSLDTLRLTQSGRLAEAALYAGASVLLSLAAVAIGAALTQRLLP